MTGRSAGVCIGVGAALLGLLGCIEHRVETEPIKVEPIHVTVDINYRVDRRLEKFFEFQKKGEQPPEGEPRSEPQRPLKRPMPEAPVPDSEPGGSTRDSVQ